MAENDEHYRTILSVRSPLEVRFRVSLATFVGGDLLLHFDETEEAKQAAEQARRASDARVVELEALLRGSGALPDGDTAK